MIKLLKNLTKKEVVCSIISFFFIFISVWLELKMPDYMATITKLVQTEGSQMSEILKNGGYMLLCAFGSLLAAVITGYLTSIVSSNFIVSFFFFFFSFFVPSSFSFSLYALIIS